MFCCKEYSSVVAIDVEDEQGHLNLRTKVKDGKDCGAPEKDIQAQVDNFLQLINKIIKLNKKGEDYGAEVNNVCGILEGNKKLITYQHCKENKIRSLLHFTKYNFDLPFEAKRTIVNKIIDQGYRLFTFSENNTEFSENYNALFFTAAKGDHEKLVKIVEHFKNTDHVSNLHDTREGDTVLSFMIKFGDHTNEKFLKCFSYLIRENIDFQRIDYFKDDIPKIINKEERFLNSIGNRSAEIEILNRIEDIIRESPIPEERNEPYYEKHELFRLLIERDKTKFEERLTQNLAQIDSDDGENTLLQLAIIKNNLDIINILLQKGVDPNCAGKNDEIPLYLAAKLNRDDIFIGILKNHRTIITENIFIKLITSELKPKLFNYLLESNKLDVNFSYKEKTPLFYAIRRKNKKAIQSLLQRGAKLEDNCVSNISPKDLEEYLNSCIRFDTFINDMEENDYKTFIVFDFFIKPPPHSSEDESIPEENLVPFQKQASEIENIRKIGSNKRLEYLLEHPLIFIFILLKWDCVVKYYYCFVFLKLIFYTIIGILVYTGFINLFVLFPVVATQLIIVYFNFLEFQFDYRRYTLHFILEIIIFLLLIVICILKHTVDAVNEIKQVSAFIIILTSLSILLTLGYHISLSKWMSMAKRVFKNFGILLLFFIFPILAFAIAFNLLLPFQKVDEKDKPPATEIQNEDFANIPRAIFRTFILLSGDIGDKQFSLMGGYILFLFFSIGMAIILLNFWTGVAVSDIKEIEEQSIVVAFNNVIVFIDGVERIYNFLFHRVFENILSPKVKNWVITGLQVPFLESKIRLKQKKKGGRKFHYGIDLLINDANQFKSNKHFKSLKLENSVISKIKSLYDDKDQNIPKTLKGLADTVGDMYKHVLSFENRIMRIEQLLQTTNQAT